MMRILQVIFSICMLHAPTISADSEFLRDTKYTIVFKAQFTSLPQEINKSQLKVIIYAFDRTLAVVAPVRLKTVYYNNPSSENRYTVQFSGPDLKNALDR